MESVTIAGIRLEFMNVPGGRVVATSPDDNGVMLAGSSVEDICSFAAEEISSFRMARAKHRARS